VSRRQLNGLWTADGEVASAAPAMTRHDLTCLAAHSGALSYMTAEQAMLPLALGARVVVQLLGVGIIVGIIDRGEYSPHLDARAWAELGTGVLVQLADGSLVHVREPLVGVRRAAVENGL
jgi:hypothetical protein